MLTGYRTLGGLLPLATLVLLLLSCWAVWRVIGLIDSVQARVEAVAPAKLAQIVTDTERIVANARSVVKKQDEEWNDEKYVRARYETLAGTRAAVVAINRDTLPRINANLDELQTTQRALTAATWEFKAAVASGSERGNILLAETTATIQEFQGVARGLRLIAEHTGSSVEAVAAEVVKLLSSGQATVEQVNARLADTQTLTANLTIMAERGGNVLANLDEATKPLGPMARTAKRWQWPLNLARLVSLLLGI